MLRACIRAEARKLRGSIIWLVFLIVPALSAVFGTFNYIQNREILHSEWYSLFTQHTLFYAIFFFSPMAGVYAAYLWRLEYAGRSLNTLMAAPVHPFCLFAAKLVAAMTLVLLTQTWVFLLYVFCGKLWAGLPGFPQMQIFLWMIRGALGAAPIIALQLLLSMIVRSFAVPVLMALGGGIAGMRIAANGLGLYWPYALMLMGMNANKTEDALAGAETGFVLACAAFTLAFCAAAYWALTRRDVNA